MPVEEQTQYNTDAYLNGASHYYRAGGQRLTIPDRTITKLAFVLRRVGSPSGNVVMSIRKIDNTVLATKPWGPANTLPLSATWEEVTFDSPVAVNEEVRILIEFTGGDASNYIRYHYQNTDVKADEWRTQMGTGGWGDMKDWTAHDTAYKYTYQAILGVTTDYIDHIVLKGARAHGTVTTLGETPCTQHGHCWSTSPNPTIADSKTQLGAVAAVPHSFESDMMGLIQRTTYYVRAYATNGDRTKYGNEISFRTSIETLSPNAPGDQCVFPLEAGDACPDHYKNVDEPKDYPDDDTTWVGSAAAPAAEPLYANSYELYNLENHSLGVGEIYQIEVFFRCKAQDTPTRASAKAVIKTGGTVYPGGSKTVTTSWADYSQVWATNPDTGLPWTWPETDALQAGVALRRCRPSGAGYSTYCTQVYIEVDYGSVAPTVTTDPATQIGTVSATLNGTLDDDGGEACGECGFEWGMDISYGHFTSTQSKTKGQTFSQVIGGLEPGTTYHFRALATNSKGTGYGADRSFTTDIVVSRAHALSREEL